MTLQGGLFLKVVCDEITVVEDVSNISNILKRIEEIKQKFMRENEIPNVYVSLTFSTNDNFYEIVLKKDEREEDVQINEEVEF